jgi:Calcium binding
MVGKKTEPKREARIIDEIIVDAHTQEERAMSWYYYLESELRFPFEAECIKQWPISPLRKGEKIQITTLAPTEHCVHQILVRDQWVGRSLDVPLAQLKPIGTDKAAAQAIADWHYWMAHENEF